MDESAAARSSNEPALALADPPDRPCPNCKSPNMAWRRYCARCGCTLAEAAPAMEGAGFQPLSAFDGPRAKARPALAPAKAPAGPSAGLNRPALWL
ncbi:MAG: hypothetical protein ACREEW_12920, partial [Caulobacteraceae bacterium]